MGGVHRVVMFVFDGVQSLDVSGPAEVLAGASLLVPGRGYDFSIVSIRGGTVTSHSAVSIDSQRLDDRLRADRDPVDTVILPGGNGIVDVIDDTDTLHAVAALI